MSGSVESRSLESAKLVVSGTSFAFLAFCAEALTVVGVSILTGAVYHEWAYGNFGSLENFIAVGGSAAVLFALPFLFRDEYGIQDLLDGRRSVGRLFLVWNYTFLSLAVFGFVTKTTDDFSRGWLLMFYVAGLGGVIAADFVVKRVLRALIKADRVECRRLMLVGPADEIRRMAAGVAPENSGARVAGMAVLPAPREEQSQEIGTPLSEALAGAVAKARALKVDDVVILTDWSRAEHIHEMVEAFTQLPVSIHLGASSVLGRFADTRVSRFAALTALSLTAPPLSPFQELAKRSFDIVVSGTALLLLSPLFLVTALLIKLSSPGPVLFRQHRRGYNHEEFRIWKFRTMTTLDDGEEIVQARPADSRVTRIGRYLRRYNIDELPQLINVLRGEMSLVGPRPHAVAHDRLFEKRIVSYPRRLNVRPGITGWAQVHGLRGSTETDELMTRRVEYDLYYIDNWSIALDLYIIALTVLSPKAYRNAH